MIKRIQQRVMYNILSILNINFAIIFQFLLQNHGENEGDESDTEETEAETTKAKPLTGTGNAANKVDPNAVAGK